MSNLNPWEVVLLSLIPSFEGRYALIVGVIEGLDPIYSYFLASLGVLLLSTTLPIILPYADVLAKGIASRNYKVLSYTSKKYLEYVGKVRVKSRKYVDKYGFLGLILFVAIPLPGSGIWTGAIAAYILGFYKKRAVLALLVGGIMSNTITLLPTLVYNYKLF